MEQTSNDHSNPVHKYVSLLNRSPSSYSQNTDTVSLNECVNNLDKSNNTKCNSDQLIPDLCAEKANSDQKNSFYYVNKNGFAVKSKVNDLSSANFTNSTSSNSQLLCTDIIFETYKRNKPGKTKNYEDNANISGNQNLGDIQLKESNRSVSTRTVPTQLNKDSSFRSINSSASSLHNQSLIQRDSDGHTIINTQLTVEEPDVQFDYEHFKYVSLFSILCWWCFPITGIASIVYSNMAKKCYTIRDMVKAKKYLKRSECLLLITFFFGFMLIALGFACFEAYLFRNSDDNDSNALMRSGIFHN